MVRRDEEWNISGDFLTPYHADVSVEPVKRDSGDPFQQIVDHCVRAVEAKLLGTRRNIQRASAIPIATVITPAR